MRYEGHPYRRSAVVRAPIPPAGSVVEVVIALLVGALFCAYLMMHPTVPRSLLHQSIEMGGSAG